MVDDSEGRGSDSVGTDNLDTHVTASVYKAFSPEEARRLADRFKWHYTTHPKTITSIARDNSYLSERIFMFNQKRHVLSKIFAVLVAGILIGTIFPAAYAAIITGPTYNFNANGYNYYNFASIQNSGSSGALVQAVLVNKDKPFFSLGEAGGRANLYRKVSAGHVLVASGGWLDSYSQSALIPTVFGGALASGEYLGQGEFLMGSSSSYTYTYGAQYLKV